MTSDERVIGLDAGFHPEPGAPEPLLLQDESRTIVAFHALAANTGEVTAIVTFTGVLASRFGYPNDEALPGHRLFGKGLDYYGLMEVLNSTWLHQLEAQNAAAFPGRPRWNHRHFIITFHDSTLECLADNIDLETTNQPPGTALANALARTR